MVWDILMLKKIYCSSEIQIKVSSWILICREGELGPGDPGTRDCTVPDER